MATTKRHKKNLIVSYKNLPDNLKELFKEAYPEGYNNYITKFVKPNGEAIFVVPFETDDTAYMVKFDVKIDTLGEDLDKALFDDDEDDEKDDTFAPLSEAIEKEEATPSHRERHLRHGDFEEMLDEEKKKKATLGIDKEGIKQALGGDDEEADELDSYERLDDDEAADDEYEPTDEDIRDIEEEYLDAEIPPLDATLPEEEMVPLASDRKRSKAPAKAAKVTKSAKTVKATKPVKVATKPVKVAATKPVKTAAKPAKAAAPAKAPAKAAKVTKPAAKPAKSTGKKTK